MAALSLSTAERGCCGKDTSTHSLHLVIGLILILGFAFGLEDLLFTSVQSLSQLATAKEVIFVNWLNFI